MKPSVARSGGDRSTWDGTFPFRGVRLAHVFRDENRRNTADCIDWWLKSAPAQRRSYHTEWCSIIACFTTRCHAPTLPATATPTSSLVSIRECHPYAETCSSQFLSFLARPPGVRIIVILLLELTALLGALAGGFEEQIWKRNVPRGLLSNIECKKI